ncbi:MAG: Asp-tRNA(Asn)/Glu-tRNA(Gln) amidotransferase subunit GatA [Bacilli bacterium]|nr:Asp-tRNA(Asn)/Glu-tRNA(Gln) amidotransferase subunit GatA [Bacilli bacterium]MDD4282565.1 Asp-tRNA(Asn)/Glu-tRNA(Gln) amidotransferase subunit GatA [Bacilli bacterium]MDD4718960.1 Asp-tRNA(Asn)/Glu-tRNA(Gln) amidotransferase subunit GatA [Bacilli bacterium]
MSNYLELTIEEINKLLKDKTIKPIDLVEEFLYKAKESDLNSFITIDSEGARSKAIELESKEVDNPLFGIPIAIKDNIVTKNLKTSCASLMLDNFVPIYDATVIEKLKSKNMIIVGKNNMDEFAMGSTGETSYYGKTLNPWNKFCVPGGSSSGSAASVGGGLVPLSLGSDTGGSIRVPSSFCGVVGMKPTYGRVSRYGLIPFAASLDQIGPISRNVYENALLLEAISGFDINDYTSSKDDKLSFTDFNIDIKTKRVAIPSFYLGCQIDSEVQKKFEDIINLLKENGCLVEYVDITYLEYSVSLYQIIALSEASSNLSCFDGIRYGYISNNYDNVESLYKNTRTEGFGLEVKKRIMIGTFVLSGKNANEYYYKALSIRKKMTDNIKKIFEEYDYIFTPTTLNVAYELNQQNDNYAKKFYEDMLAIPANMTGVPALSLPIGFNKDNMPIGLQIMGNYFKEEDVYKIAYFIENNLGRDK